MSASLLVFAIDTSNSSSLRSSQDIAEWGIQKYVEPQLVEDLIGEEAAQISVGSSHACAVSKGGDCYVWGYGKCGALGLGNFKNQLIPAVVTGFGNTDQVKIVETGENHTCALTEKVSRGLRLVVDGTTKMATTNSTLVQGEIYAWGHVADGRLGLGARERVGVSDEEKVRIGSLLVQFQFVFFTDFNSTPPSPLAALLPWP